MVSPGVDIIGSSVKVFATFCCGLSSAILCVRLRMDITSPFHIADTAVISFRKIGWYLSSVDARALIVLLNLV